MSQSIIPVFYTERMVSDELDMMSPSPFKPRQVADAWRSNIDFPLTFIKPVLAKLDELFLAQDGALCKYSTQAFDRLSGMWQLLTGLSLADYEFSDEQHPRLIAKKTREDNLFVKRIPEKIVWFKKRLK